MATLNLNGTNITLPDGTVFTTSYLTGSNNVTNNNAGKSGNATLTEGGSAGNIYSGTISDGTAGTTAITQTSGFVEFTGTNTYSGGTNLEGGTIGVDNNSALGTGTLTISDATLLNMGGSTTLSNAIALDGGATIDDAGGGITLSGVISGTGSLYVDATGEGSGVELAGTNTYSGGTTIAQTAGTFVLAITSDASLGATSGGLFINSPGAHVIVDFVDDFTLSSSRSVYLATPGEFEASTSATIASVISGAPDSSEFILNGGTLTLSGANTYSGGTLVDFGTLVLGNASGLGNTSGALNVQQDGTVDLGGFSVTTGAVSLGGTIKDGTLTGSSYSLDGGTVSAILAGSGSVTVTGGTNALSGANSYSGGTNLNSGTVAVGNNSALGSGTFAMATGSTLKAAASTLTLTNNVTLTGSDTVNNNGDALTLSGVISGSGSLTETGSGTLTLSDTNTYTGGTSVAGGTLLIDGSTASSKVTVDSGGTLGGTGTAGAVTVDSGGTFAPGDPSTLTVAGLTLNSGATFDEEIGGTAPGNGGPGGYDQTVVESGGTISLGGATLDVSLVNSFAPSVGESFTIINNETGKGISGTFDGLAEGATFEADSTWFQISYVGGATNNDVTVTDVACYCAGTLVRTPCGNKRVEKLQIGDEVMTASGVARPIKWMGRRSYSGRFVMGRKDILPVCIKAGALADNVPRRDLWISPNHAMFFEDNLDGVLIEAKDLVNGVSIVQAERVDEVEYFHVELDTHDVLIAEGALSESFIDDDSRGMFHNAHEYRTLYTDAPAALARYCAPRRDDGYEVEAIRQRLALRAGLVPSDETARAGDLRGYVDRVTHGLDRRLGAECRSSRSSGLPRHLRRRSADRAGSCQPLPRRPRASRHRQRPP